MLLIFRVSLVLLDEAIYVNVNFRFAPGRSLDHVERVFDKLLERAGGRARYEVADFAPSGSVDLDHPLLQSFISGDLEVRPKQAWTDVARFAREGVAAANFGPGLPAQAHQQNEYVQLPLLLESYDRLRVFLDTMR